MRFRVWGLGSKSKDDEYEHIFEDLRPNVGNICILGPRDCLKSLDFPWLACSLASQSFNVVRGCHNIIPHGVLIKIRPTS